MEFINKHNLSDGEYFPNATPKDTIYLHHTEGSHRPDLTIDYWDKDRNSTGNKVRVSTAYVIGGISTRNQDDSYDGKIYEAFDPSYWSHHLGIKNKNNTFLNQKSIAIEICNYGILSKTSDGRFFNSVKCEVPKKFVTELDNPFRGSLYYHSYTTAQIESLRKLLIYLSDKFEIDIKRGIPREIEKSNLVPPVGISVKEKQKWLNKNGFTDYNGKKLTEDGVLGKFTREAESKIGLNPLDINQSALDGYPGVWSHTNVRIDKSDIYPHPGIMEMLANL
jgi:hypothetical protein